MSHKIIAPRIVLAAILVLLGLGPSNEVTAGINIWDNIGPAGGIIQTIAIDPLTPGLLPHIIHSI